MHGLSETYLQCFQFVVAQYRQSGSEPRSECGRNRETCEFVRRVLTMKNA